MNDTAVTENEPSIEEILDSIKQIISDEDDHSDAENVVDDTPASPQNDTGEDDDVLVLTETVAPPAPKRDDAPQDDAIISDDVANTINDDAPADVATEAPHENTETADIEIDMRDPDEDQSPAPIEVSSPQATPKSVDMPTPEIQTAQSHQETQGVFTEKVKHAALEGFSNLVRQSALERGGITLEDIVRSELNPLLRDWLDQYLPDIIERAVKEELHEITKRILS